MFSNVLMTVDFDRTLTGPDSVVPKRNREAIAYFIANGGSFTVNTGRTPATFWKHMDEVPCNAPMLMFNGSAAYDNGVLTDCIPIDLPVWPTMQKVLELFPDMNLEIQGEKIHYLIHPQPAMIEVYEHLGWKYTLAQQGQDVGQFLKFALFGQPKKPGIADMYDATEAELRRFREVEETIRALWGDKVDIFRPAPRIIDVHAKGVSKAAAAKRLQQKLGKKLLVCVGDGQNDVSMLQAADFAYCPADSAVADLFENVCSCGQGAVADVIYEKLPKVLK